MKIETVTKVGMREFRAHLPKYILKSSPVAVTRHGETVGYYIPTKHHTEQPELDALIQAARTLEKLLSSHGLNEDQLLAEFRGLREKAQSTISLDEESGTFKNLEKGL
ncbi:MAG: type II toxin-antitoxin system Phd/YefM family antitoxin [Legionella longbeachae]|nr:type II toxin-antitoxin system Phd/YefM family antitoxin [Legionella longbeachae]